MKISVLGGFSIREMRGKVLGVTGAIELPTRVLFALKYNPDTPIHLSTTIKKKYIEIKSVTRKVQISSDTADGINGTIRVIKSFQRKNLKLDYFWETWRIHCVQFDGRISLVGRHYKM